MFVILCDLSWTAIVASHLDTIRPLAFTGGLALLTSTLLVIDLFDIVNYSDSPV